MQLCVEREMKTQKVFRIKIYMFGVAHSRASSSLLQIFVFLLFFYRPEQRYCVSCAQITVIRLLVCVFVKRSNCTCQLLLPWICSLSVSLTRSESSPSVIKWTRMFFSRLTSTQTTLNPLETCKRNVAEPKKSASTPCASYEGQDAFKNA